MPVLRPRQAAAAPKAREVPKSPKHLKALQLADPAKVADPRWLPMEWTTNAVILLDDPAYTRSHCAWHLWNDGAVSHVVLTGTDYDRPEQGGYQTGISCLWDWRTNTSVVIGLVDQMPDFTHPDLAYMGRTVTNVCGQAHRTSDHGTRVAGIIGGQWGNGYAAGVAQVERMVAAEFDWSEARAIDAIFWVCAQGAKVVNCSWGFCGQGEPLGLKAAMEAHPEVVFVCAVVNDEIDLDANPIDYPTCWGLSNVLSVGYYDRSGSHFWSGYGSKLDLEAPGRSILMPGVVYGYTPTWEKAVTNTFGYGGGSSYAAAVTTGVMGLVMEAYGCSALEAKSVILKHREGPNKRLQCAHLLADAAERPRVEVRDGAVVVPEGWVLQRSVDLQGWVDAGTNRVADGTSFYRLRKEL